MKARFFAWLAHQLAPHLEPLIRAAAAAIVADIERELGKRAAQPNRRFIGQ
jgi:hypothetical protein